MHHARECDVCQAVWHVFRMCLTRALYSLILQAFGVCVRNGSCAPLRGSTTGGNLSVILV